MGVTVVVMEMIYPVTPAVGPVVFMKDLLNGAYSFVLLFARVQAVPVNEQGKFTVGEVPVPFEEMMRYDRIGIDQVFHRISFAVSDQFHCFAGSFYCSDSKDLTF